MHKDAQGGRGSQSVVLTAAIPEEPLLQLYASREVVAGSDLLGVPKPEGGPGAHDQARVPPARRPPLLHSAAAPPARPVTSSTALSLVSASFMTISARPQCDATERKNSPSEQVIRQ